MKQQKLSRKEKKKHIKDLRKKRVEQKYLLENLKNNQSPNEDIEVPAWINKDKSTQNVLRYSALFEDGLCEIGKGVYSFSLQFDDISYQIAGQDVQDSIFTKYCQLLNYFPNTICAQITVRNTIRDVEDFKAQITIPYNDKDTYNEYRLEYNQMLLSKSMQGDNSIDHTKYLTVTFHADDYKNAIVQSARIKAEIGVLFKALRCPNRELSGIERAKIFHSFFNDNDFSFSYSDLLASGLSTKDYISPEKIDFTPNNYFTSVSDGKTKYSQIIYLKNLPAELSDKLIADLSDLTISLTTNIYIRPTAQDKALELVKSQRTKMDMQKSQIEEQSIQRTGVIGSIPFELKYSIQEADILLDDMQKRNQKLFRVTILVHTSADTAEELIGNIFKIKSTARRYNVELADLEERQEEGINSILPIGACYIDIERNLTTVSTAIFVPFTTQELLQTSGVYYGQNALSQNLILIDRREQKNGNAIVLGVSGGGKSFKGKEEMVSILMRHPKDEVIVIDPEGENVVLAEMFGGEVVTISASSQQYINPFDMDIEYGDDQNPLYLKSEFILSWVESVLGVLTPIAKSVLDRCVKIIYDPFFANNGDPKFTPTLKDLSRVLKEQPQLEAQQLVSSLELYVDGSLSVFAHQTNVNTKNRFVVYNTMMLGGQLKALGMLNVMDSVWNRVLRNHRRGIRTWVYADEFQVYFDIESSSEFFSNIWARFRKRNAFATGLTQNVNRLLMHDKARFIISNSELVIMLDQAKDDREALARLLDISDEQLEYIKDAEQGNGLIRAGASIVPFIDKFPTDTKLYKAMSTKPQDFFTEN